jgi:5-methylcytosine-specific restriction endonuclease McrA
VHHVVFRSHGGDDVRNNLLTICDPCHSSIHRPHPRTGACLVVISKSGADTINTDDLKDTGFLFVNGFKPGRRAA